MGIIIKHVFFHIIIDIICDSQTFELREFQKLVYYEGKCFKIPTDFELTFSSLNGQWNNSHDWRL